ncbi:EthD family reductase [Caulobacter sp.]|uniref:EthD family reductase n=1 Tax=Caulobacter sp. TaxID=78 RepID=UPI003BAF03E8
MVIFSVLYPATPGAKFDQAYYDAVHIPLAKEAFTPTGLKDVQVLKGLPGPDGSAAPFVCMVHLTFESPEALAASLGGPRAPEVLADVAKFTDIQPVTQVSAPG